MDKPIEDPLSLLGRKFDVLDDGFVILIDFMGEDAAIEAAARVSYGEGTRKVSDTRHLIRYLMRHRHTTPFEMCEIKILVKVPMDCWRQWIRHRTASVNEYSTRYSIAIDSAQKTLPYQWRQQSLFNKQGSQEGDINFPKDRLYSEFDRSVYSPEQYLSERESEFQERARDVYEERLKFGVSREQARKDLPLSTYTMAYWKIDLHNLFHFLKLRLDPHAQQEIREYARVIYYNIVKVLFPIASEAFEDYILNSITLSAIDVEIIKRIIYNTSQNDKLPKSFFMNHLQPDDWVDLEKCRERDEFLNKAYRLELLED